MKIIMTSDEIRKKYPLTNERIKKIKEVLSKEPDLTDPDTPEITDKQIKKALDNKPRKTSVI